MSFKPNIPQPNDFLSDSQNDLLNNFTISNAVMDINHYTFANTSPNKGKHKYTELVNNAAPAGASGEGILYTRTVTTFPAVTESELFYKPDASVNQYQLTRTVDGIFVYFGQNVNNYNANGTGGPVGVAFTGGWTFLPGTSGMILAYGSVNAPGAGPTSVIFPVTFTAPPFLIELTPRNDGNHSAFTYYIDGAPTTTQFTFRGSTSGSNTLYWMALGI